MLILTNKAYFSVSDNPIILCLALLNMGNIFRFVITFESQNMRNLFLGPSDD